MPSLLKSFVSLLIILVFSFTIPKIAKASQLNWRLTYPSTDESTAIKIVESDNNTIYAGVRKHPSGFDLLKSGDFGASWSSTKGNLSFGSDPNWISVYDGNKERLAISLWGSGIHLSEDGGQTWSMIYASSTPRSVEINPSDLNTIFVGIGGSHDSNSGVYKTINKGLNWTKLPLSGDNNAEITIDKFNGNRIFADADPNFFRSLDGGTIWTQLPINRAYANTVIDSHNSNTIYSTQWDFNAGVYKSLDNGDSWSLRSNGIVSPYYRLAQDTEGTLYASRVNSGGGVWRSTDGAENWENVGDPSWGTANTWGLDAKGGRVVVSVEGLGIFIANADGTPIEPQGPKPVVFLPGLGGSFSFKGLILNQDTTYSDWTLVPKLADPYYQPLFDTLKGAGLTDSGDGQNLFVFAYDYRKSIGQSASWLNDFLDHEVLPKNPGKKVDLIGHSMGGMVASYCFLLTPGCADKIDKIIYGGSPLRGSPGVYDFWEAGKIDEKDLLIRTAERLLLQLAGFPQVNPKDIVQTNVLGARDILPIFDYKGGQNYSDSGFSPKNPVLEALQTEINNPDLDFEHSLTTFSGSDLTTLSSFSIKDPNKHDQLLGWWTDGKPHKNGYDLGDKTVLKSSSEVAFADNRSYPLEHSDYFRSFQPLTDTLAILGLTGPVLQISSVKPAAMMIVYTSADVQLKLLDQMASEIGKNDGTGKVIFLVDPPKNLKKVRVSGNKDTVFEVSAISVELGSDPIEQKHSGFVKAGESKELFLL